MRAFTGRLQAGTSGLEAGEDVAQGRTRSLAASLDYGFRHAFTDALLSSGPLGINPLHDPLSEDHGIRDDGMQSRGWPRTFQLTKLAGSQDCRSNQENALAGLVH